MRTTLLALALAALAACDGGTSTPAQGPPKFGLANNDQATVVSSGTQDFGKPVVGKVVRSPGGITGLHIVTPLYADTTVLNGSPVAGAVVCMDQPVTGGPAPSQLCNNTAADGTVAFFYRSGTKADTFVYHANATVDGVPVQPDSARFVQEHGGVAHSRMSSDFANIENGLPLWLDQSMFTDAYSNQIPFTVTVDGAFVAVTNEGNGTRGIQPTPTATTGDTGHLVFSDGSAVILHGTLTLKPGQTPTTWGVTFAAQP